MALGTPVAAAAAYSAAGGTTVTPAYPSGILATDDVLLFVGQKPSTANGGTVTTPTGWTLRDSLTAAGGYGTTLGADTGNTNLFVYSWDTPVAGQTGNLSVTLGTNDISWAFIVRIPGGGSYSYGTADGQRTTTPTSPMTVALTNGASATNFQSGDLAIWAMCIPTDVTTPSQFSAQSVTATGATFATAVELNEPDSNLGNDIGGYSAYASVSSGSSTAAPSVTVTLAGTLTNVRGPVVMLRVRDTSQALTPARYDNSQTFFAATVTAGTVTLTPALYTNDQTFYAVDVTQAGGVQNLDPSLYTNTQTFYSATVEQPVKVQVSWLEIEAQAVTNLFPDRYDNSQTFYAATVSQGSSPQNLTASLFTNSNAFYAPTVTSTYTLTVPPVENTSFFYGPTITQGTTLLPDRYDNANAFYAPTVTPGAVTLTPARYDNAQAFYAPTVTPGTVTLLPGRYDNTQEFYSPVVTQAGGPQYLLPALFVNDNQFFAATVTQQDQPVLPISDVGAEDGKRRKRQKQRDRKFEDEKKRQAELREQIMRAVEPVTQSTQPVVVAQSATEVQVVRSTGAAIQIDVPGFDAAEIAREVASVLQAARVQAEVVRATEDAQRALEVARAAIAKIMKRRRDDELMLLMD